MKAVWGFYIGKTPPSIAESHEPPLYLRRGRIVLDLGPQLIEI